MLLLSIDNITVAVWMEVAAVTMGLSLLINLAAFLLGLTSDHLSVRRMGECPYFDTRRLWSLPLGQKIMIILTTNI